MSIWNVWRNCCDFAIFNFHQTFSSIKIELTWNILRLYSIFPIVIFDFISKLVEWLVWVPISATLLDHTSTDYSGAKNRNLLMPLLHLSPEITFKFTILPARNIKTLHQKVNKLSGKISLQIPLSFSRFSDYGQL